MVGNRRREFRDAVLACREDQWEGWPVRGPRTTHWALRYIVDHGGTPTAMGCTPGGGAKLVSKSTSQ
eukprot:774146-Pyramimonas_sp.AAC.1